MPSIPWILILILTIVVILAILAVFMIKYRKKQHKPDYYTFFIMGIIWFPLGVVINNPAFYIMGLVFMAIGLANKSKWKENHRTLKDMGKDERKLMIIVMVILGILVLVGSVVFLLVQQRLI